MRIDDIIQDIKSLEEFRIVSVSSYQNSCTMECTRTKLSGKLLQVFTENLTEVRRNFIVLKSGEKIVDKAYREMTACFKTDAKGKSIDTAEWNRLYCSCDNRQPVNVRVLHITHKVCRNCKKSIIN